MAGRAEIPNEYVCVLKLLDCLTEALVHGQKRQRVTIAPVHVAHLNFAASAAHKVCLAKGLSLWLASGAPEHRAGVESISSLPHRTSKAGSIHAARWTRSLRNASAEFSGSDGLVITPQVYQRHRKARATAGET